jgi:tRNA G46 methylase TrmB
MVDGGILHLKTDCRPLYDYALALLHHNGVVPIVAVDDLYSGNALPLTHLAIQTAYETYFRSQGSAITYLQFAMPVNKIWEEPADFIFNKNVAVAKRRLFMVEE